MLLYGICRQLNRCVCDLCALIPPQGSRIRLKCDKCGVQLRKDHNCRPTKTPRQPHMRRSPAEAQRARRARERAAAPKLPVVYAELDQESCGCIFLEGRRIRWCHEAHNPVSYPNPVIEKVASTYD